MKNLSLAYLIAYSIFVSATSTQNVKEWTDPHDMGLSNDPKARPQNPPPKRELTNNVALSENRTTCPAELFFHRHIQRLSKVLSIDQPDMPRDIEGLLEISLNKYEASLLYSFSVLSISTAPATLKLQALHSLEPVLEKLVSSTLRASPKNNRDYYLEVVVPMASLWLENIFFVAPMIIAFSLIYCLWRGTPLWLIVLSFILISFAWEWSHMLKQVLAKKQETFMKHNGSPPHHCIQPSMLHQLLSSVVSGPRSAKEECVKYREAVHVNAFLEVTPLMAASECISKVILHPLEHLGDKLGLFFSGVLSSNSYLASFGVLTFSFCILVLFVVTLSGYSIKLPFISIEPTKATVPTLSDDQAKHITFQELEELKSLILSLKANETDNSRKPLSVENLQSNTTLSIENLQSDKEVTFDTKEEVEDLEDTAKTLITDVK